MDEKFNDRVQSLQDGIKPAEKKVLVLPQIDIPERKHSSIIRQAASRLNLSFSSKITSSSSTLKRTPVSSRRSSMAEDKERRSSPTPSVLKSCMKSSPTPSRKLSVGQMSGDSMKKKSKEDMKKKHVAKIDLVKLGMMSDAMSKQYINDFILKDVTLLYDQLDINGNDFLQAGEILCAFHSFGFTDVSIEECTHICEEFSRQKGIEMCTLQDFQRSMFDTMKGGTTDDHLKMVFNIMDADNQGSY